MCTSTGCESVIELYRVLKPTGSFYLHCDWHAAHYLKVMLDGIFGEPHFQNEVIWYYRGAGVSPRRWARRHDNIFFYTKGATWTFNVDPVRDAYAQATTERFKHYVGNVRGPADFGEQQLNPKGKHPDHVWQISIVAPSARDRLGYPTQKPEKLMERIVLASSSPETSCWTHSRAVGRPSSQQSVSSDDGSGSYQSNRSWAHQATYGEDRSVCGSACWDADDRR